MKANQNGADTPYVSCMRPGEACANVLQAQVDGRASKRAKWEVGPCGRRRGKRMHTGAQNANTTYEINIKHT